MPLAAVECKKDLTRKAADATVGACWLDGQLDRMKQPCNFDLAPAVRWTFGSGLFFIPSSVKPDEPSLKDAPL